ncbi:kelch repeat-containing protein [Sorangium sp. So ce136]
MLVAGGDGSFDSGGNRVEIYDPVADTWTEVAPMSVPRDDHTATLLLDGRVLVTGGLSRAEYAGKRGGAQPGDRHVDARRLNALERSS